MTGQLLDITRPLHDRVPVWPGDDPFRLGWTSRRKDGDGSNVAVARFGMHTGTHLDAPLHIFDHLDPVDLVPLEVLVGRALVVDSGDATSISAEKIRSVLAGAPGIQRLLFRTGAWLSAETFPTRYPFLDATAVPVLLAGGIRLIGTDAPSIDPLESADLPAHHAVLSGGILILENLLLDEVTEGEYDLMALPLKIVGADASPVRAVLRTR